MDCTAFLEGIVMNTEEHLEQWKLMQRQGVFPLGVDSLKLAAFATVKRGWQVCDLGTGSGVLLLLLAQRERSITLSGIDMQTEAVQLTQDNLACNGLAGEIRQESFQTCTLPAGMYDLVISNPPYFQTGQGGFGGNSRMGEENDLQCLCTCAAKRLKNGGRFALSFRPERLAELFATLQSVGIEPKRLQFVVHTAKHTPSIVLVEGMKQGKPGLQVLPLAVIQSQEER